MPSRLSTRLCWASAPEEAMKFKMELLGQPQALTKGCEKRKFGLKAPGMNTRGCEGPGEQRPPPTPGTQDTQESFRAGCSSGAFSSEAELMNRGQNHPSRPKACRSRAACAAVGTSRNIAWVSARGHGVE